MKHCRFFFATLFLLSISVTTASAQLFWDINSSAAGATSDGGGLAAGTWDCCGGSAADYNGDGVVDVADYVAWRKNPGGFGGDPDGYDAWVTDFGVSGGGGGTANWSTDATGASATVGWTAGQTAVFSAGTNASGNYVVTLSGTQTAAGVTFQEGTVTLSGAQLDLTGTGTVTTATGTTSTISSIIGGSVALTKAGADRLLISGANIYSGGTNINAGTLQFANTSAMPISGDVTVNAGSSLSVNAGGVGEWTNAASGGGTIGGLIAGTGGQGAANQVAWNDGSTLGIDTINAGGTLTYSNVIGSFRTTSGTTNAVGLTKRGTGTLALSGANTYTGSTTMTVNSGKLKLEAANTLPAATVLTLPPANGGATVELYDTGGTYYNQTIAGLNGGGIGTTTPTVVDVGFAELTLDIPTGESHTYTGYLKTDFTNPTVRGKVIKEGPGEFILAGQNGTSPHAFAGEFIMNEGRLGFANNVVLGVNNDISKPATLRINGGTLFKANAPATALSMTPRTVDIGGSFTFDLSGTTANAQILPAAPGSGVGGFNLLVDNPTITVTIPSLTNPVPTFILAGVISDGANSYGLTKAGNGTLTLNNPDNNYQGPTTILEGVLRLGPINATSGDGRVGDGTGVINLSGGAIEYNGAPSNGDGLRSLTVTNPINVTANSAITYRTAGGAAGNTPGLDFVFSSNSIGATGGTLTLLNDGSSNEPSAGTPTLNPVLFKPTFTGVGFDFDRPIVISNHATIANRTTALTSANTSGIHEFSGDISGNGGYLRNGAGGTSILSGNNSYTGNTTVQAGTLSITNPYLYDFADVLLTTGSFFNLDFPSIGTIDDIDQLFIDGVSVGVTGIGTWGEIGSGADNETPLITGDGWLRVTAAGSGGGGAVPEPGTLALAMIAVFAIGTGRRRD